MILKTIVIVLLAINPKFDVAFAVEMSKLMKHDRYCVSAMIWL